jgi:dTDP-4-dehydrorhamnose 3,5-epimerase-like enzyme
MVKKIKVKNARIIKLQFFNDFPDGNLVIGEEKKSVPFAIKRFYFINHLYNSRTIRGWHAHKNLQQIILCLNGSFQLTLDDGRIKQKILMNDPYSGVYLGPNVWRVMTKFSPDCVILAVASDFYKESDYIRDYQEFLKYVKSHKK